MPNGSSRTSADSLSIWRVRATTEGMKLLILARGATFALAAFSVVVAAQASAATNLQDEAKTVNIGFEPELGKIVRYRITRTKNGKRFEYFYNCRFERNGGSYRLTVTPDFPTVGAATVPVAELSPDMAESFETLVRMPIVLNVSAEAEVTGVANEAEFSAGIRKMMASITSGISRVANPEHRAWATNFVASLNAMPMDSWHSKFLETVNPVVEFAALDMEVGKAVEFSSEVVGPGGTPLTRNVTIRLDKAERGTASISMTDTADRAAMLNILSRMMAGAPVPKDSPKLTRASQQTRATYEVAIRDGKLRRYEAEKKTEMVLGDHAPEVKTEVTIIELTP